MLDVAVVLVVVVVCCVCWCCGVHSVDCGRLWHCVVLCCGIVGCGIVPPRRSLPAVIVIRLQTPAMEKVLLMTLKSKVKAMMINLIIDYGGGGDRDNQDLSS